ncbi:hypothetical protein GCM10023063_19430 [Arthrobacter methylotrophus]|uniref:Helicase associated domain-containing protein n=1 Tax=Arthrobacter methylotrophus TaxID=121291 RepID=A0ABV5UPA0_9MICC
MSGTTKTSDEWICLYRSGITGAGVAHACDVDDILEVLNVLAEAKRRDPSLETEHTANLRTHDPDAQGSDPSLRGLSQAWQLRLAGLRAYVWENGRMPRQGGGGQVETSLGRWLHAQRLKATKGTLEPRQRAALDAVGKWDSDRREHRDAERFPARLKALADFRERRGRLPSHRNRTDDQESSLGAWLHALRQAAAEGRLPGKAKGELDATVPDWNN